MDSVLNNHAPGPAQGGYADGFEPVAKLFADQLVDGTEVGAGFTVYHRGECVLDLWGGLADPETERPWERDTRICLFSVSKGFVAMALHLLADRGELDWEAPVAEYWPEFAQNGKADMTVATLLGHRGGLAYLDEDFTLADCTDPQFEDRLRSLLEKQSPNWPIGQDQGYHAITWGMYATELFAQITGGQEIGEFLRQELFAPLDSDVYLGAPAELDGKTATLITPPKAGRVLRMIGNAATNRRSTEARVLRKFVTPKSTMRRALLNPSVEDDDLTRYNKPPVRRAALGWASATGSAHGVARAYLPFAMGGEFEGQTYLKSATLAPLKNRWGWAENDLVLQKPIGWTHGFCKEERHLFSPNPESFGHPGMGGTLGWADPVEEIAIGYAMNRMDWRIRSPRIIALCRKLYDCQPLVEAALRRS